MKIKTCLAGANFRPAPAKEVVRDLAKGEAVTLQADPANPYDPNAVQILARGEFIGFVAKANNVELAQHLASGGEATAKVWSIDGGLKPLIEIEYAPVGE